MKFATEDSPLGGKKSKSHLDPDPGLRQMIIIRVLVGIFPMRSSKWRHHVFGDYIRSIPDEINAKWEFINNIRQSTSPIRRNIGSRSRRNHAEIYETKMYVTDSLAIQSCFIIMATEITPRIAIAFLKCRALNWLEEAIDGTNASLNYIVPGLCRKILSNLFPFRCRRWQPYVKKFTTKYSVNELANRVIKPSYGNSKSASYVMVTSQTQPTNSSSNNQLRINWNFVPPGCLAPIRFNL